MIPHGNSKFRHLDRLNDRTLRCEAATRNAIGRGAAGYSASFQESTVRVAEEKLIPSLIICLPEARNGLA
jgi:hypothetical protein